MPDIQIQSIYRHSAGILIAGLTALLPFAHFPSLFYGAVSAKYFLVIGVATLCALYLGYLLVTGKLRLALRGRWLFGLIGAALLTQYLAAFLGVYPERSLFSDILRSTGVFFLTYVAFLAWFSGEMLGKREWMWVWKAAAISGALFSALSFLGPDGLHMPGKLLWINFEEGGLTFGNSTFAGAYLALTFVITLVAFFNASRGTGWRYVLGWLAAVQALSPLFLNGQVWSGLVSITDIISDPLILLGEARMSSVAVALSLAFLCGLFLVRRYGPVRYQRVALGALCGGLLAVVISASALLFVPGSFIQDAYIKSSTQARIIVWQEGWQAFRERPLFGWGPENFRFAHERHLDNRLYLEENLGEIWFDRAHNVVVDSVVGIGALGTTLALLLALYFLLVVARAARMGIIRDIEAYLWGMLLIVHFLQLQSSFNTVATYALLGLVFGYGLWLERHIVAGTMPAVSKDAALLSAKIGGGVLIALCFAGAWYLGIKEYQRQSALVSLFRTTSQEVQVATIPKTLSQTSDFESLRLSSSSFINGVLAANISEEKRPNVLEQLSLFQEHYELYLGEAPEDYRARMNYAYLLLAKTAYGDNHVEKAKTVIEQSYALSPNNPLTFVLDAIAALYAGNMEEARERIEEGVALDPNNMFTQAARDYIEDQIERFPKIAVWEAEKL